MTEQRKATPVHHTATTDSGSWDAGPNEKRLPSPMSTSTANKMYAYYDQSRVEGGKVVKAACSLPHHQVSADGTPGAAHLAGVRNALSRLPQSNIPTSEHDAIRRHLQAHLDDAKGTDSKNSDGAQLDLVRVAPGIDLRRDADDAKGMSTLYGHFAVFDTWYRISSRFEGDFLEKVTRGVFVDTFGEHWDPEAAHRIKIQFQHGRDPYIGQKLLGALSELHEDKTGGYYEVPLFDTAYNRELVPGLESGEYGASFRFRPIEEHWDEEPGKSDHNPDGLAERTILRAVVYEIGPVAFGASPTATAGLRSATDEYYEALRERDPSAYEAAVRAARPKIPTGRVDPRRTTGGGSGDEPTPADDESVPTQNHLSRQVRDVDLRLRGIA